MSSERDELIAQTAEALWCDVWGDRHHHDSDLYASEFFRKESTRQATVAVDALLAHPEELVAAMEEAGVLERAAYEAEEDEWQAWLERGQPITWWVATDKPTYGDKPLFRVSSRLPTEAPE